MNIFKKGIAVVLILVMMMPSAFASTYKDVDSSKYYAQAVEALSTYGIVSGYAGYFNPEKSVTRAEFAKMITLVSGLEDEVYSKAGTRRFDDVALSHWGNGYINTAAENKLIVGYPNGLFMPEKKITFAEAVTVLLRAMNYTTQDLGDNWPYAYMVKAKGLGITEGINLGDNSFITRGDLAVVINKALQTSINGSTQKLISKMDINMTEEVLVIATKNEDASLASNEVKTSGGTYKLANTDLKLVPLTKVELVLNDNQEVINFATTYTPKKVLTTVEGFVDGVVYFENGSNSRSLGVTDSTPVYSEGVITGYGSFKSNIEDGAAVSIVYGENGSVDYLLFNDASYTEAVVVRTDIYSAFEAVGISKEQIDNARIIKNGESSTLDDISQYDVAYYLADNSTVYLYSDRFSGIYNEAFPSKASVSSVDISGNIFEIETQSAAYKLGEKTGSYKLKSAVTALLGRDGKIVDVVDLNSSSGAEYGILLSYTTEMSQDIFESGKQYKYVTLLNGEGNTVKYQTTGDYTAKIGDVGKISFDKDGNAVFVTLSKTSDIKGKIDKNNRKIGDRWLTQDCVILERTFAPETRTGTATAQVIDFEEITLDEFDGNHVIFAATSGLFGDISLLIVEGVTSGGYTYGILTANNSRISTSSASGSYTVFSNGQSKTYSTNFASNIATGTAVAMNVSQGGLTSLKKLVCVKSGTKMSAIDFSRIKLGNDVYRLGTDVQLIKKNSSGKGYVSISLSDAEQLTGSPATIYADASVANGGLIRVILFN